MLQPSEHTGSPMGALHALVLELFTAEEFRRWLRHGPDADIVPELPGESTADATVVEKALGALERRGRIDASFFMRMSSERARKADAIAAVAVLWRPDRAFPPPPAMQAETNALAARQVDHQLSLTKSATGVVLGAIGITLLAIVIGPVCAALFGLQISEMSALLVSLVFAALIVGTSLIVTRVRATVRRLLGRR